MNVRVRTRTYVFVCEIYVCTSCVCARAVCCARECVLCATVSFIDRARRWCVHCVPVCVVFFPARSQRDAAGSLRHSVTRRCV